MSDKKSLKLVIGDHKFEGSREPVVKKVLCPNCRRQVDKGDLIDINIKVYSRAGKLLGYIPGILAECCATDWAVAAE